MSALQPTGLPLELNPMGEVIVGPWLNFYQVDRCSPGLGAVFAEYQFSNPLPGTTQCVGPSDLVDDYSSWQSLAFFGFHGIGQWTAYASTDCTGNPSIPRQEISAPDSYCIPLDGSTSSILISF